jgi:lipopolysaccharide biosynthesis glycosyltransferase
MATAVSACTIVSANYITFAKVLAQSYLKHHPGHKFYVLLVDSPLYMDDLKDPSYELISVDDIPLPFGKNLYLAYTVLELNTAVKPFFIEYLFTRFGCEKIAYIDPDVLFFNSMQLIYDYLDDYSVVLIPHILMPYKDDETPSEVSILQCGTYNLGFIALKNSPSANIHC